MTRTVKQVTEAEEIVAKTAPGAGAAGSAAKTAPAAPAPAPTTPAPAPTAPAPAPALAKPQPNSSFARIAVIYLLGLLLGGLYVGIVAPMRTVIQAQMGIDSSAGIWIINIYTLFYAATIPLSGNLGDRYGRKVVFSLCMGLFVLGSLVCGASEFAGSFALLLTGRVIQAFGAGGIIPVATAAMGASAPEGKRGMWLGVAAAVAGVANTIGSAVGSLIAGVVGVEGWCWSFFLAVPLGILMLVAAVVWLPKDQTTPQGKIDLLGAAVFTAFVLCLLLGLKGVSFEDPASLADPQTWAPLLAAIVLLPVFARIERKADDPVFRLEYLHNRNIVLVMVASFFVGCSIISMTLVPEFAEQVLNAPVGSGGYYMATIGVFAIVGPPMGGKLIDRFGAKPVMAAGLVVTALGYGVMSTFAAVAPGVLLMILALAIVGLGMGFTMGTPLNYMILENTTPEQSTSAIATISLVRQMGTTLAPALLVGFIASGEGLSGYGTMMLAVAAFNLVTLLVLLPYRSK